MSRFKLSLTIAFVVFCLTSWSAADALLVQSLQTQTTEYSLLLANGARQNASATLLGQLSTGVPMQLNTISIGDKGHNFLVIKSASITNIASIPSQQPLPGVPEPSTCLLVGIGIASVAATRKRV